MAGPSFFQYPVGRPYPFRWFTVFVFVELLLALMIFSIVNYATTGYTMISEWTIDPNITVSRKVIPQLPDILTSKSNPTCQSSDIAVGSTVSTNNSAIHYVLNSVKLENQQHAPSLVYYNNPLEDCTMNSILMSIESVSRNPAQVSMSNYGVDVSASITCFISTQAGGRVSFNITAGYTYVPPSVTINDGITAFVGRNTSAGASLYYADITLAHLWVDLVLRFNTSSPKPTYVWGNNARLESVLYLNSSGETTDLTSLSYYEGLFRMIGVTDYGDVSRGWLPSSLKVADIVSGYNETDYWYAADNLAKAFESAVMTDLGQTKYTPNMFADEALLKYFTSNFTLIQEEARDLILDLNVREIPLPDVQPYDSRQVNTGPLEVHPSVFSTIYMCQLPRRKSPGDLFLSILVADIVLVSALWSVTMSIASWFAQRKDASGNWCEGCAGVRYQGVPSTPEIDGYVSSPTRFVKHRRSPSSGNFGGAQELDDFQQLVPRPRHYSREFV